jgi:hypothetical protein
MAKSGFIDLRLKSTVVGDIGRRTSVTTNLTMRPQKTHSTRAEDSLSLSNGGGKIIRLYPRAVASRKKPALPMWDKNGEYNVTRFAQVALVKSTLQRGGRTAKSQPKLLTNPDTRGDDDYHHRMLENALASAVLVVLVISGQWIFTTLLASIP